MTLKAECLMEAGDQKAAAECFRSVLSLHPWARDPVPRLAFWDSLDLPMAAKSNGDNACNLNPKSESLGTEKGAPEQAVADP